MWKKDGNAEETDTKRKQILKASKRVEMVSRSSWYRGQIGTIAWALDEKKQAEGGRSMVWELYGQAQFP